MKCKKGGCDNEVTRPQMAYCSAPCAPLAHLIKSQPKSRKIYTRKDDVSDVREIAAKQLPHMEYNFQTLETLVRLQELYRGSGIRPFRRGDLK